MASQAFRIMVASYGIAFLRMFKLQHVSLILRKSSHISSKENRMQARNFHLKAEKNLSDVPLEDQILSEKAPCLNKLILFYFIYTNRGLPPTNPVTLDPYFESILTRNRVLMRKSTSFAMHAHFYACKNQIKPYSCSSLT